MPRLRPGHPGPAATARSFWPEPLEIRIVFSMGGWAYIVTNKHNGTLYVGVTADIRRRAWEHREGVAEGFTSRYGLKRLIHAEWHDDIRDAIHREKRIKHWSRKQKLALIEGGNPDWADLYDTLG